jgi:uncharacterized protein (TIGR00369 family)
MTKLNNPYANLEGYNCFACSPNNPFGLKMEFLEDGEDVVCNWEPDLNFQGWFNVLHGGIQATLLDEAAAWLVMLKCDTAGVTSNLEVKYKKPVELDKGNLLIKARIVSQNRKFADIESEIYNAEGEVLTIAKIKYYLYPKNIAEKQFYFEGSQKLK